MNSSKYPYNLFSDNNPIANPNIEPENKKKSLWSKLWFKTLSLVGAGALILGVSCGISFAIISYNNQNSNSGSTGSSSLNKTYSYNDSSSASYWISQRTISLLFEYSENNSSQSVATAGTGWIYQADQSTNTYYVATNLHVANILSFENQTVTSFDETSETYETITYGQITTYFGLAIGLTPTSNSFSDTIAYFPIATPEVIYTTTSDSNFNNLFNTNTSTTNSSSTGTAQKNYYGEGASNAPAQFYGAVDIAVLKLTIDPTNYSTNNVYTNQSFAGSPLSSSKKRQYIDFLKTWISNYFANPTKIYTDYVDNLTNLDTKKIYMGGFPSVPQEDNSDSLANINWLSFSDFTITTAVKDSNNKVVGSFNDIEYPGNDYCVPQQTYNAPIAFYSTSTTSASDSSGSTTNQTSNNLNNLKINKSNLSLNNINSTFDTNPGFDPTWPSFPDFPWTGTGGSTGTTTSIDSNYTNYNYLSIGVLSYLEATSFPGSSGSPIVIQDNNGDFMVAGIYWGGLSLSTSTNETISKGIMTWFATNSYKLGSNTISYNLTSYIADAIQKSESGI